MDVKRLRQIETENARLKKLLAERDLKIEVMKEIAAKNCERARASVSGNLRSWPWRVDPTSVRANVNCSIGVALRVTPSET